METLLPMFFHWQTHLNDISLQVPLPHEYDLDVRE